MEFRGENGHSAGGLKGEKSVAEICREHQISQTIIGGGTGFWRQDRRG